MWKRLNGNDHFVAPPVFEADLVINLPKLKTHVFSLYTGAIKNLFGVVPGSRKRDLHCRAPGIVDFSQVLVDVLELVQPGLTIVDGVLGQEGDGPGTGGTPRRYGCLAASRDSVAVDTLLTQSIGYRAGEVLHLDQAGARGLGVSDPGAIRVEGGRQALDFGTLSLSSSRSYFRVPSWASAPLVRAARLRPGVMASACVGCGQCVEACPRQAIMPGRPPIFGLDECIGCLCCAEIWPKGAIEPRRNLVARLVGIAR